MNSNRLYLNDGNVMPQLGYGLWQVPDDVTEKACLHAIHVGYRSIDTAQIYGNERGLGRAIQSCGLPRQDLYITTKIWNTEQGHESTLRSFEDSLKKLKSQYVDLLLIHWPAPKKNLYVETWKALIQLKQEGRARSIGVSNFNPDHLERIIHETSTIPAVNQIEVHPRFQRKDLRALHDKFKIVTEAWSPLGQGKLITDPVLENISEKHGKSPAQIILRWHLDMGLGAIPKSINPSRVLENFQVFGFKLDQEDHDQINRLDSREGRIGPDPMTATF
jgi:2,5-diketo-D-gluconate reductase A